MRKQRHILQETMTSKSHFNMLGEEWREWYYTLRLVGINFSDFRK